MVLMWQRNTNNNKVWNRSKCVEVETFNPLHPGVAFWYPLKTPIGFLMFSGGIEKQHWTVMNQANPCLTGSYLSSTVIVTFISTFLIYLCWAKRFYTITTWFKRVWNVLRLKDSSDWCKLSVISRNFCFHQIFTDLKNDFPA